MRRFLSAFLLIISAFIPFLTSCETEGDSPIDNKEQIPVDAATVKRTLLIYAVNKSSLESDFEDDTKEILLAMPKIDLNKYQLLIYKTDSNNTCGLYKVSKFTDGSIDYVKVKGYKRDVTSTEPHRVSQVVSDALSQYPNSAYDLIFWGHGMSWKPYFSNHDIITTDAAFAFGGEYNGAGYNTDWIEINELADALPDNKFGYIWFDACYMSSIETIYEFRNKCNIFVGYPSEVYQYGMAYDEVIPYLLKDKPDIKGAAQSFFDYYNISNDPVTVAVIDMIHIEEVADAVNAIVANGYVAADINNVVNYSRSSNSPFYDFLQYFKLVAQNAGSLKLSQNLETAYNNLVIYHDQSKKNFDLKAWDYNNISGISTHRYNGGNSKNEDYYRTLSWSKRVGFK